MGFSQWVSQLDYTRILEIVIVVIASLFCIILHECAHGLVALWLGDPTAKRMGRLTLNPIRHIDPLGLLMMVVAHFGWAKPVPVDMRNFKKPKWGMALTALAGPVSNFLIAVLFTVPMLVLGVCTNVENSDLLHWIFLLFAYISTLSIGLGVFNLLPIPPLDGSKILFSILPSRAYYTLMRYERYGMLVLLAVDFLMRVLPGVSSPMGTAIYFVQEQIEKLLWPLAKGILKLIYPDLTFI